MFPNDLFSMFDDMLGTHSHSNNNMTNRLLARLDRNARSALLNANKFSNLAESNQTNIEHLFTSILEILATNNIKVISEKPSEMLDYAKNNLQKLGQKYSSNNIVLGNDVVTILNRALQINMRLISLDFLLQTIIESRNEFVLDVMNKFSNIKNNKKNKEDVLSEFGVDLTNLAKQGKLSPVIGRAEEIERTIHILSRKQKNNPILLGEPGVGKTAIAEGLALKIVNGEVPESLQSKRVFALDLTGMLSGTQYRGSFEEKAKKLIEELSKDENTILFIDEIHTIVGAGSTDSKLDLANMLKPALARGELSCIGATTNNEYKKYFAKDAALERRFQPVFVNEPSVNDAIVILRGLKDDYEKHHSIIIEDDALVSAVVLSDRYIRNRFLPDKAIDILDEACAKLSILPSNHDTAKEIEEAVARENFELAAELKRNNNIGKSKVDHELITEIISKIAKIPVGKLSNDDKASILELGDNLQKQVIGQNEACNLVANCIKRAKAGLNEKESPLGAFLFLGPTGVGKTELAKSLALNLFGSSDKIIRLDMSEFMDSHSSSKIIGSPPGFVGYEEGGYLTEKVSLQPFSIVLLDEIEKAHPSILNLFLQLLDDGRLTDNQGKVIDFSNTIIIATSNVGAEFMLDNNEESEFAVNNALKRHFRPEFLNRFDEIIQFNSLDKNLIEKLVLVEIDNLNKKLSSHNTVVTLTKNAKNKLVDMGYSPEFGARPLKRVVKREIESIIADLILKVSIKPEMQIDYKNEKGFFVK